MDRDILPYIFSLHNRKGVVLISFGFRKSSRKVCGSWVLSLHKRVRVSACKIRTPDTHVFVPTLHKSFLDDLLESKEISPTPLIQGNSSNCGKGHMQPYSSKRVKRVVTITYHPPITKNPVCIISRLNLFLWNFHVTRKVLGGMRINARVSGMRSLHADTPVCL